MTLYSSILKNTGRPIHKCMHYAAAYERHFGRFVGQPMTFLEIGVGNGGSSQMWKGWLGPRARIVSIDINPASKQFEDEQVAVRLGDQSDAVFLQSLLDEFGRFDVVLDDGSHVMAHVRASFEYLYPRIAANGVYMIEDVHAAYWSEYGGGYKNPDSVIEFFKDAIDLLNVDYIRGGELEENYISRSTSTLTAWDSILVYEKTPFINTANRIIGDQSLRTAY